MTKRRKPNQNVVPSVAQEKDEVISLRFKGELLELTPTADYPIADYPIQVLQTEQYGAWIHGIANTVMRARITNSVDKMQRGLFSDWKEVG